jgi:hypothetical protein
MSAPKQLAKRQKLERKRRRKRENSLRRQKTRQADWREPDGFDSVGIFSGPVAGVKMSDVFEDFVGPMLDSAHDQGLVSCEQLFSMAQVAWNAALEPKCCRGAILSDAVNAAMPGAAFWVRQECREFLDCLVARKLERFANYDRPILAFHLDELEDGSLHLSVVSGVIC